MKAIFAFISDMIPTLAPKISQRRLSEAGRMLLDVSGGKRCIDENTDLFSISYVMSIYLRDIYLEIHQNILTENEP